MNVRTYRWLPFLIQWGESDKTDRLVRARQLFDDAIARYRNGDERFKPITSHFNVLANTISQSDSPDKEMLVLNLFEEMEKMGCTPCLVSFNMLIKTCAAANEGTDERRKNAIRIAVSAFGSLEAAGLSADSVTYTSMFRAMLNLMDNSTERTNALACVFRRCCEEGRLNQHIINTLLDATTNSAEDFQSITGIARTGDDLRNLPAEWSRNSSRDTSSKLSVDAEDTSSC